MRRPPASDPPATPVRLTDQIGTAPPRRPERRHPRLTRLNAAVLFISWIDAGRHTHENAAALLISGIEAGRPTHENSATRPTHEKDAGRLPCNDSATKSFVPSATAKQGADFEGLEEEIICCMQLASGLITSNFTYVSWEDLVNKWSDERHQSAMESKREAQSEGGQLVFYTQIVAGVLKEHIAYSTFLSSWVPIKNREF